MAANPGVGAKLGVGDANPITNSTTTGRLLDFQSESIAAVTSFIDGNGIKGIRSRYAARCRNGDIAVGGNITFNPVAADLAYLMQKVMGGASLTAPTLANTIPSVVVQKQYVDAGDVWSYPTMYIASMSISGSRGNPISVSMDLLGLTESQGSPSGTGGTFPNLTLDTSTTMLVFNDLSLSLGGSTEYAFDFNLTINNFLTEQRVNSRNATAIFATDRVITLSCTVPEADITYANFSDAALECIITLSNASQSAVFTLPSVRFANQTAVVGGRDEIVFSLNGTAYRTAASAEMTVAIDSTP